jgi:hypothetical protein
MEPLTITQLTITQRDEQLSPGDLHARVSEGELQIPADFAQAVRRLGVRTAADLVGLMQSFPTSVAEMLSWPIGDVQRATERLKTQLEGLVPPRILNPPRRPNPVFGAQDPGQLSGLPHMERPYSAGISEAENEGEIPRSAHHER